MENIVIFVEIFGWALKNYLYSREFYFRSITLFSTQSNKPKYWKLSHYYQLVLDVDVSLAQAWLFLLLATGCQDYHLSAKRSWWTYYLMLTDSVATTEEEWPMTVVFHRIYPQAPKVRLQLKSIFFSNITNKKLLEALRSILIDLVFLIAPLQDMRRLNCLGLRPAVRKFKIFLWLNDRNKCSSKYICTSGFKRSG